MEQHIKILSVLFIIFGILGLIVAVGIFMLGAGTAASILANDNSNEARVGAAWAGGCITFVAVLTGLISIPSIIAGWGLSKRKSWARILAIIIGLIALPQVPIGTALGIYAIIIMFNDEAKALLNA
jgi:hypothetical protein